MSPLVCIDASLAAKWILREEYSEEALALLAFWEETGVEVVGPPHLPVEMANVLRKRVTRGEMSTEEAQEGMRRLGRFRIAIMVPSDLYGEALRIAEELQRPSIYDAVYLALAQFLGCELWTDDRRLLRDVGGRLTWVRWIGNYGASAGT